MPEDSQFEQKNLTLNPEVANLTRFSKSTELFNLLVTEELLNEILIQIQLHKIAQAINKSKNQKFEDITLEDIKILELFCTQRFSNFQTDKCIGKSYPG